MRRFSEQEREIAELKKKLAAYEEVPEKWEEDKQDMKRNPARAESLCRIFVCGTGIAVGLYLGGTVRMRERISTGKSSKKRSAAYNNTDTDFKECAPWNRNFPTTWFIRCRCCLMRKSSRGEILEYMKALYPDAAKRLTPYVEEECDRLMYAGSVIYDEYPDPLQFRLLCRRYLIRRQKDEEKPGAWMADLNPGHGLSGDLKETDRNTGAGAGDFSKGAGDSFFP